MAPTPERVVIAAAPNPMVPAPFRVQRLRRESHDTFTLELLPANEAPGSPFSAGQFNMLYVFGVGEVPMSISGDPGNPQLLIHTTRAVGVVTRAMRKLKPGDMVGIRGPFGNPWPLEEAAGKDVLIVAGGLGLAPLRPVVYQILSQRPKYGSVILLYGARTPGDILYLKELERWRSRLDLRVEATVDRALTTWRGRVGVVTGLIPKVSYKPQQVVAMVCGPEVMMRFTVQALENTGIDSKQIYISMERNMKCAVGFCGHCQFGPQFICKEGPVFRYDRIAPFLRIREL
jgi:NAD(P)H-flavin reductase